MWFGLKNATDLWQMIDAGYAQLLKASKLIMPGLMMMTMQTNDITLIASLVQVIDAF